MLQFSLRNLLIAVAAVAVGTAALINANGWWASLLWTAALLLLAFAGLAALFRREARRAFWSGYVLAGSLYLLLLIYSIPNATTGSGLFTPLSYHHLATTRGIVWTYALFPDSKRSQYLPPPLPASGGMGAAGGGAGMEGSAGMMPDMPGSGMPGAMGGMPGMGGMGMGPPLVLNPSYIEEEAFLEVGHALWLLLFSWLGGTVAFWLYRTRETSSSAGASGRVANS